MSHPIGATAKTLAGCARVVVDWVLPRACAGCDLAPQPGSALCSACRGRIAWSAPGDALALAPDFIELGFAAAWYEGVVETWLRRFKYPGKGIFALQPGPAAVAGELIGCAARELAGAVDPSLEIDAVVPVPSPIARIRERGFHPAGNLARVVSATLRRPVLHHRALLALGERPSQTGLSRIERKRNVAGAFCAIGGSVEAATLLLVDDVVTTGATLESAARALRGGGAERVFAVCAARARLHEPCASPPDPR